MGQKVHPKSLRLKINTIWDSSWFAGKKNYASMVLQDINLRTFLTKKFKDSGVSKVFIERNAGKIQVTLHTAKPGLIIGRQGTQIDELRESLKKEYGNIEITVKEIKKPELDAAIVGDSIGRQIERRVAFRRAAKQAVSKAISSGAKGVKVILSGRLNGVEIARREQFKEGNIPLHTLRSCIDYAEEPANTIYGVIGIKVWIYKGDSFRKKLPQAS
jgi:small subunit ribosomal protein S3